MEIQNVPSYSYMQQCPMVTQPAYSMSDCSMGTTMIQPQQPYCISPVPDNSEMWTNQTTQLHPFHENINWTSYGYANPGAKCPPMSAHAYAIARRNERERNRVRHINSTFENLRKHLPHPGRKRKLSKVDTLKTAVKYIQHLQQILDSAEDMPAAKKQKKIDTKPVKITHTNNNNIIKTENEDSFTNKNENCELDNRLSPNINENNTDLYNRNSLDNINCNNTQSENGVQSYSSCSVNDQRLLGLSDSVIEDNCSQSSGYSDYSSSSNQFSFSYGSSQFACRTKCDTRQAQSNDQRESNVPTTFIADL